MNWFLMLVVAAGLLVIGLGGCTPSMVLPRLHALEGIVEVEVDAIVDEIEDRRCKLPIDVLERTSNRRGLKAGCRAAQLPLACSGVIKQPCRRRRNPSGHLWQPAHVAAQSMTL